MEIANETMETTFEYIIVLEHFALLLQYPRNPEVWSRFDVFFMIINFLCRQVYNKILFLIQVNTSIDTFSMNASSGFVVEVNIGAKRR